MVGRLEEMLSGEGPLGSDDNEVIQTLRKHAAAMRESNPSLAADLERAAEAHSELVLRAGPTIVRNKMAEIRRR